MAVSQQPSLLRMSSVEPRVIQGDPAARRVGIVLFIALVIVTIGAGVGIGVGNIAHYRYFPPTNQTITSILIPGNQTVVNITGLVRSAREIYPKIRQFWFSMSKSLE